MKNFFSKYFGWLAFWKWEPLPEIEPIDKPYEYSYSFVNSVPIESFIEQVRPLNEVKCGDHSCGWCYEQPVVETAKFGDDHTAPNTKCSYSDCGECYPKTEKAGYDPPVSFPPDFCGDPDCVCHAIDKRARESRPEKYFDYFKLYQDLTTPATAKKPKKSKSAKKTVRRRAQKA